MKCLFYRGWTITANLTCGWSVVAIPPDQETMWNACGSSFGSAKAAIATARSYIDFDTARLALAALFDDFCKEGKISQVEANKLIYSIQFCGLEKTKFN